MKQIDKYVNSVYQNASGDKKAIEELKLEMKNHLLEAVSELKESGRTEQEAINIAIERFGEEKKCVLLYPSYLKFKRHLLNGFFILG